MKGLAMNKSIPSQILFVYAGYYNMWHYYFGDESLYSPQPISTAYDCLAHVFITAIDDKDHIDTYLWYNRLGGET